MPQQGWSDRRGDIWFEGGDELLHAFAFETAPFSREHVERKWGPLVPWLEVDLIILGGDNIVTVGDVPRCTWAKSTATGSVRLQITCQCHRVIAPATSVAEARAAFADHWQAVHVEGDQTGDGI